MSLLPDALDFHSVSTFLSMPLGIRDSECLVWGLVNITRAPPQPSGENIVVCPTGCGLLISMECVECTITSMYYSSAEDERDSTLVIKNP